MYDPETTASKTHNTGMRGADKTLGAEAAKERMVPVKGQDEILV